MKYVLYTTAQPSKVQPLADWWARELSKTKGRGEVTVKVVRRVPRSVKIELDPDKHRKFKWDWFTNNFPAGDYDGVIFYFSPYLRRKWKMTNTINGSRNPNNRKYPEFWICCDLPQKAKGYDDLLEIHRLLFHEHGHYDEDVDDNVGDKLNQDSVHQVDYTLKKIHQYHLMIDYRGQALKHKVDQVVRDVTKKVKEKVR
jgi:hypothetical protein